MAILPVGLSALKFRPRLSHASRMNDDPRTQYWNEQYLRYWRERVEAANCPPGGAQPNGADAPPPADRVYEDFIGHLDIPVGATVLEMGCGYGRAVPILYSITPNIAGIDISEAMIGEARTGCAGYPGVTFAVSEAEHTPFPDAHFDRVICFGVFDALYQREALLEMNRILTTGGRVLITGKNDAYFPDDEAALVAERNARAKGHPNYFTDVTALLANLNCFGFRCCWHRFYARRSDMAAGRWMIEKPDRFYEYCLILEKLAPAASLTSPPVISAAMSKTFSSMPVS